jgi:rhodanese-related sulfurtransferase
MKLLTFVALIGLAVALRAAEPDPHHDAKAPAQSATGKFTNVGPAEFEKLRADKQAVVLDVRTPKEYAAGHIPGSVNIDANAPDFEKRVATLDPKKTYLVHCAAGVRSVRACGKLSQLNFEHLYNLEGGMKAWEKAGNAPAK